MKNDDETLQAGTPLPYVQVGMVVQRDELPPMEVIAVETHGDAPPVAVLRAPWVLGGYEQRIECEALRRWHRLAAAFDPNDPRNDLHARAFPRDDHPALGTLIHLRSILDSWERENTVIQERAHRSDVYRKCLHAALHALTRIDLALTTHEERGKGGGE
jgi:hypothetical protein